MPYGRALTIAFIALPWALGCSKNGQEAGTTPPAPTSVIVAANDAAASVTTVTVDRKGFTPSNITVEKGTPLSLSFVRSCDETCTKEVVFPELDVRKDLPLNQPVVIDVPTVTARTLTFQCGMAMYKSAVVVR